MRILFLGLLSMIVTSLRAQVAVHRQMDLMGSRFDITVVAETTAEANEQIDQAVAEIRRIEELISEWMPASQVSEVNRNAGIRPVKVDRELYELTHRAVGFSGLTGGAFDISIAAMDRIWVFDGTMDQLPSAEAVRQSVDRVGYQFIELDSTACTIFLTKPGMKIGFGATGKGYAADKGRQLLLNNGVEAGIVNASGDMTCWGEQPNGKPWAIGVTHPNRKSKLATVLKLRNAAVVTSGNYEKYAEIDGRRYSHIINPVTGIPSTELISVTVLGTNAEIANAFSTSIMVLGKEHGLKLIAAYPDYACLIIENDGKIICSPNFKKKLRAGKKSNH